MGDWYRGTSVIERLDMRPDAAEDECAKCGRVVPDEENALSMTAAKDGVVLQLLVCRSCLSEYAPDLLATLETPQ